VLAAVAFVNELAKSVLVARPVQYPAASTAVLELTLSDPIESVGADDAWACNGYVVHGGAKARVDPEPYRIERRWDFARLVFAPWKNVNS
jgi:hypothetical protein